MKNEQTQKHNMSKFWTKLKKSFKDYTNDPFFTTRWDSGFSRRRTHADQKSVWISARRKRTAHPYYHDSGMLVDDMYMGIMPFLVYRGESEKYPLTITPPISRDVEKMIAQAISDRSHAYRLNDALCDFVRSTAQTLFQEGVAYFEINQTRDDSGQLQSFELESISPYYLYKIGSYYYQFVPWTEAMDEKTRVQFTKIPESKVLKIELPKNVVSGRRKLKKILKRLYFASKELFPEFHMEAMKKNEYIGFDVKTFSKNKYLESAQLTKDFGWDQRSHFRSENYITEYYSMELYLRKKRAQANVRKAIINGLNSVLGSAQLNLGIAVEMQNLFTAEQVDEQEALLRKGGVKFMDIFNTLNI